MADKIAIECDACGKKFKVSPDLAGEKARCPCGQIIEVPEQKEEKTPAQKKPKKEKKEGGWYYLQEGDRMGPVPLEELQQRLKSGEMGPKDSVWTTGMESWLPAEEVEVLSDIVPAPEQEGAEETEEPPAETAMEEKPAPEGEKKAARKAVRSARPVAQQPAGPQAVAEPETEPEEPRPEAAPPAEEEESEQPAAEPQPAEPAPIPVPVAAGTGVPALLFARIIFYVLVGLGCGGVVAGIALVVAGLIQDRLVFMAPPAAGAIAAGLVLLVVGAFLAALRSLARGVWSVEARLREGGEAEGSAEL